MSYGRAASREVVGTPRGAHALLGSTPRFDGCVTTQGSPPFDGGVTKEIDEERGTRRRGGASPLPQHNKSPCFWSTEGEKADDS